MSFISNIISSIEKEDVGAGGGLLASVMAAVAPHLANTSTTTSEIGLVMGGVGAIGSALVWALGKMGVKKATILADEKKAALALPVIQKAYDDLAAQIPALKDVDTKIAAVRADVLNNIQVVVNDAIAKAPVALQPDAKAVAAAVEAAIPAALAKVLAELNTKPVVATPPPAPPAPAA